MSNMSVPHYINKLPDADELEVKPSSVDGLKCHHLFALLPIKQKMKQKYQNLMLALHIYLTSKNTN